MIFPCSVNAEQSTQDVLSSERSGAEEESMVVLDSRYYSFTQPTIMENHFSTVVVKFCESWCKEVGDNRKRRGKDSNIYLDYFLAATSLRPMRSQF